MLEELVSDLHADNSRPNIWDGTILETAMTADDLLHVALPGADSARHAHGPCPFMPRGDSFPQAGDRCLVAFDDDGDPWIIAWIPS